MASIKSKPTASEHILLFLSQINHWKNVSFIYLLWYEIYLCL